MKRYEYEMKQWCDTATCMLRFQPDRKKVHHELRTHLQEHFDALVEQGIEPQEAADRAREAMGDPLEVAPLLAAVHRPFWGFCLRISQVAMIALLCVCTILGARYVKNLDIDQPGSWWEYDMFDSASYGGDTGRTLHYLLEPGNRFTTDYSIFTLSNAVISTKYFEYYGEERNVAYFRLEQISALPIQEYMEYTKWTTGPKSITANFYAVDSHGNTYTFCGSENGHSWATADMRQTGIFTAAHDFWINDFHGVDAKWIDICYDRDGRDIRIRIPLTGGDGT